MEDLETIEEIIANGIAKYAIRKGEVSITDIAKETTKRIHIRIFQERIDFKSMDDLFGG